MRRDVGLPPLHTCCVCHSEVDIKSNHSLSLVKGWVKANGKTLAKVESQEWLYLHEHCLPRYGVPIPHNQERLF